MTAQTSARSATYRERLWPTPWLFVALLLVIPAVAMMMLPLNAPIALPLAIAVYVIVSAILFATAPSIRVEGGELIAGSARIPVSLLGEAQALDAEALRRAIGPGLDARAHLLIRGTIHRGVKIAVTDPADPAPYWVLTTRNPRTLIEAIDEARSSSLTGV